jgi:7,8-dihydropterin-6-yl-methyl-4-(beta-D-ribofuranosyl)aminobenzene 5'-phosphate synthase
VPAYVPTAMTHPTTDIQVLARPRRLRDGVASSGPIHRAIWWTGGVAEQTLLVEVEGKGTVMIVGCGHASLARMIERAQAVTGKPLYGIVGGLHFPVTGSRMGRGMQTIIGSGKLPWQRITRREAVDAARSLAGLELGLAALSAHDSCDWTLDLFKGILGDAYRMVRVGEEIVVSA